MKKHEIRVGGLYTARVSGRFVTVRVDAIREVDTFRGYHPSTDGTMTVYDVTNLTTGRRTTFRSAAKFRSQASKSEQTPAEYERQADGYAKPMCDAMETAQPSPDPVEIEQEECDEDGNDPIPVDQGGEQSADPTNSVATTHVMSATTPEPVGSVDCASAVNTDTLTSPNGLAAKIAATMQAPATNLTQQQQDILAVAKEVEAARNGGQRVLVIGAGAGTGKTFSLKELSKVLTGIGQGTAFNKSLVSDNKPKFKIPWDTTHALAYRAIGYKFKHRLNGKRVRSWEIANRLGIDDYTVELPASLAPPDMDADGKPIPQTRRLKAAFLAGQTTEAIRRFCQSADSELGTKHFARFDGIDEPGKYHNSDKVKAYLLPFAQKALADMSDPNGTAMPFSHDMYVKLWEMGTGKDRPVIAADYILLDEAQDTAPVMLSILRQQTHALLILVGDDNQQIYEWRGAINAMATFPGAPRKLLSQSFRFGQTVADVANAVLGTLEEPTDLVMSGLSTIPTRVCAVKEPRCYLYRTNAGAISKLMQGMDEGKRGHMIGGTKEVVAFCRAALDLQRGQGTTHPELGCFTKWSEVQEYAKEDEGADLRLMVKLIDDFGADRIIRALENMPAEKDADFVCSTAHRSKGREWTSVRLGQDFKTANKLDDAERRLVYVAATRAQEELDLTVCPTFCGGYDKKGGGEDGSGEAAWIPGIEVNYTVPMPSEEELATYRAEKAAQKSRPESPTIAPDSTVGQSPALPAQNAATHAVGTANGNSTDTVVPISRDGNTWTKGRNGGWVVRGKPGQSGTITVTKKNGTTSRETIRRVIWQDASVALYEV